ncbi:MAG: DUF2786 domain-containing protein [Gammaproteobacteria bacterium]|nr:DUF2786 domain-containing protein [Gammaproteobacteria bacterium]MDH5776769.1 DUF2786 domain-containing protein [Gammaproteobacteria bacterium]
MDKDKVIEKICKCLALSESCNPNEAAAAIRQAQGLMKKYGISENQIITSNVKEAAVSSGTNSKPPFWALALAEVIAKSFACKIFISSKEGQNREFRFIGLGQSPLICSYTFRVLHRRLKRSRKEFIQTLDIDSKPEKTRRGDVFAQAWLFRITQLVNDFADTQESSETIEEYLKQSYGELGELSASPKEMDNPDYEDILSGMRAAHEVKLYNPIEEQSQYPLGKQAGRR